MSLYFGQRKLCFPKYSSNENKPGLKCPKTLSCIFLVCHTHEPKYESIIFSTSLEECPQITNSLVEIAPLYKSLFLV